MSETALVKRGELELIRNLDDLLELGRMLVKSGMLPKSITSPEAAAAIILKGRELGMPPMESFSQINVIQGKPTLSAQAMLALIHRSGQLELIDGPQDDGQQAKLTMQRRGHPAQAFTFSMAEAKALGLAAKDNWQKQPATMRGWRVVSKAARVVFPDVIAGMYTPEELGAVVDVESGEILELPAPQLEPSGNGKPRTEASPVEAAVELGATVTGDIAPEWIPLPWLDMKLAPPESKVDMKADAAAIHTIAQAIGPTPHLKAHLQKHYNVTSIIYLRRDQLVKLYGHAIDLLAVKEST